MERWYIAKSKPRKEAWLTTSLGCWGVEVFYPRTLCQRRGKRLLEPLFPTYLFCRFDLDTPDWLAIRWAPGLSYFLGTEGRPAVIPDDMVAFLKQRVEKWNDEDYSAQRLCPGDRVMIADGPFAGLEGIFQRRLGARQRCIVLLRLVGRLAPVEVPESGLTTAITGL